MAKGSNECFETQSTHAFDDGIEYLSDMEILEDWEYTYQYNYLRFIVMCEDENDDTLFGGIIA